MKDEMDVFHALKFYNRVQQLQVNLSKSAFRKDYLNEDECTYKDTHNYSFFNYENSVHNIYVVKVSFTNTKSILFNKRMDNKSKG